MESAELSAVVPAQAGTHTPQQGDVAGDNRNLGVMGPRLRGDDSGLVWSKAERLSRDITEPYCVVAWDAVAGGGPCSCAFTLTPGRARISPLTITRSSAVRPSLMTRMPTTSSPSVTYFCRAIPSPSTASTYLRACSLRIAPSGRSSVA